LALSFHQKDQLQEAYMKKTWWIIGGVVLVLLVAGVLVYRGVARGQANAAASVQTATVERGTLTASLSYAGTIRPGQSATISWQASGKVGKVKVTQGESVQANQELADLDTNALPPSIIKAKQDLIDAQKTLDDLLNSTLQQAQNLQAVQTAQKNLDDLKQTVAQNSADAQVALATAQKTLDDAQKKQIATRYPHSTDKYVIQNALTKYLLAKEDYKTALQEFDRVDHKPLTNSDRANALQKLVTAEQKMKTAFATYNWYVLMPTQNDMDTADANLAQAQANLTVAQTNFDSLKDGPDSVAITLAESQLADAQRAYERSKDGPNPEDVSAAQAAVDAAQATLDQAQLLAPFAGTITQVDIKPGDLVNSSTSAFRIDDLSSIYVDLQVSEIDINSLQLGQQAALTFDAIPNKEYAGKVTAIGIAGTVSQGVVNYPVTVQIINADEVVKPGMTAAVNIIIARHDNVLIVPNQAIRASADQRTVTVLYQGQQIPVTVTVGLTNATTSEVIGNQLREGDEVVINQSAASSTSNNGRPRFVGPGF
jgi:HlyD family secretion protein